MNHANFPFRVAAFSVGTPSAAGLVFLLGGYPENEGGKRGGKEIFVGKATDYGGPKLPPHSVSYSEAASGLLTSLQGTDAVKNLSGTPYSVRL